MQRVVVRTFADLLKGHECGQIHCLYTGLVVRHLSLNKHGNLVLKPGDGPTLVIPAATPLQYEPWEMDRGSLIFKHHDIPGQPLKLCGEGDIIRYEDGTEATIHPAPDLEEHPHELHLIIDGL
jgi:hypothetical protein